MQAAGGLVLAGHEEGSFIMRKAIATASMAALLALGLFGCAGQAPEEGPSAGPTGPEAASSAQGGGEEEARALMEGLFAQGFGNVSVESSVEMEVGAGAASQEVAVETAMMLDTTSGEPRLLMSIESDPANPQTDMAMHLVGTEAVVERDGEASAIEVEPGYAEQLMGSTGGSGQARAVYDAAQSVELAQEGSLRVVRIVADPAALTASGAFAQISEVASCEASYAFDGEGRIVSCEILVEGPSADSPGAALSIATSTAYSDYGTTVVPDLE